MITEFGGLVLDIPSAVAIGIARADEDHYPAIVDQALDENPYLLEQVSAIPAEQLLAALKAAHVGNWGTEDECRRRLVYWAARSVSVYLQHVADSSVMSAAKYDALRAAYRELLDYHLSKVCA